MVLGKAAERLQWMRKPTKIKNVSYDLSNFHIKWFEDGELNASVNCLDRQLETRGDKTALLFEPDGPDAPAQHVTYRELYERTCRLGNALRNLGVEGRPGHHLPADDRRRRGGHGLRAHRCDPLGGVRWLRAELDRRPSATARAS